MVNLGDQLADVIDMNDDGIHRQTRLFRQRMAFAHFSQRIANQLFNLFHRVGAAPPGRELPAQPPQNLFHARLRAPLPPPHSAPEYWSESDGLNHARDVFDTF
jgi:hypothetical protein